MSKSHELDEGYTPAALVIDRDAAPDDQRHAVAGTEFQVAGRALEHHAAQLRATVLEGEQKRPEEGLEKLEIPRTQTCWKFSSSTLLQQGGQPTDRENNLFGKEIHGWPHSLAQWLKKCQTG